MRLSTLGLWTYDRDQNRLLFSSIHDMYTSELQGVGKDVEMNFDGLAPLHTNNLLLPGQTLLGNSSFCLFYLLSPTALIYLHCKAL